MFYIRKDESEVLATPVGQKISEYMNTDPKKIIHYERKLSEDSLTQYFKIGFKDEATYNEFLALTDFTNSRTEQQAWCSANSLTYELKEFFDNLDYSLFSISKDLNYYPKIDITQNYHGDIFAVPT